MISAAGPVVSRSEWDDAARQLTYIGNVVPSQEDLGNWLPQVVEQAVPEAHQPTLADGSERLQFRQVLGPLVHVHPPQPDADGSGRDDDDLVPVFPQPHRRLDDGREDGEERLMGLLVDDGAGPWRGSVTPEPNTGVRACKRSPGKDAYSPSLMTTPRERGPLMAAACTFLHGQNPTEINDADGQSDGGKDHEFIAHAGFLSLTQGIACLHFCNKQTCTSEVPLRGAL